MKVRGSLILTLFALVAVTAWAQSPRLLSVEPDTGKQGDELVASGQSLDKAHVADLFLTAGGRDTKVKMVEQSAESIRFSVPKVRPGRYKLMILTRGSEPTYLEQPVFCTNRGIGGSDSRRSTVSARTAPLLQARGEDQRGRRSCPPEARATPDLALLSGTRTSAS